MTKTTTNCDGEKPASAGFLCPSCGRRKLFVVYTRNREDRILRVRQCRFCSRRVMTFEQVYGGAYPPQSGRPDGPVGAAE